MNSKCVLGMDPSGAYKEGKGKTGWCLMNLEDKSIVSTGYLDAKEYDTCYDYWAAHIQLICNYQPEVLVLEDYLLYASKAQDQINSRFETSQLLGIIKYMARTKGIPFVLQPASLVKKRWDNNILSHQGIIEPHGKSWKIPNGKRLNGHMLDAIRHSIHFANFGKEKHYELF